MTKAKNAKFDTKNWPSSPSERVRVLEVKFSSRASPVKVWGSRDTADTGRLGFYLSRYMISRIFIQYFDIQGGKHIDQHRYSKYGALAFVSEQIQDIKKLLTSGAVIGAKTNS